MSPHFLILFFFIRLLPRPALFPYTTLFRSCACAQDLPETPTSKNPYPKGDFRNPLGITNYLSGNFAELRNNHFHSGIDIKTNQRSEEHTSELQSRENLVCRLLLEKKKKLQR